MIRRSLKIIILMLAGAFCLRAGTIDGNVIIQHKLTKRTVTPSASLYDRGAAVELGSDQQQDPLAYERTHVVIYLEGDIPGKGVTGQVGEIAQADRRFSPDLVVVPVGSTVSFPNMDPIFHNVFSLSKAKSFDLGNYPKDHTHTVSFPKPGIIIVGCHLHSNMAAVIVVTPNVWSTKADAQGRFTLPDVPAGTYTIVAWHKSAGFFRKTIQVGANQNASVDFVIPITDDGPVQEAKR